MPLIYLPAPPSCEPLVTRLRALESRRPCPRRVEVLVLRMGSRFDVSTSSWDDEKRPSCAPFEPFNSPRWRYADERRRRCAGLCALGGQRDLR